MDMRRLLYQVTSTDIYTHTCTHGLERPWCQGVATAENQAAYHLCLDDTYGLMRFGFTTLEEGEGFGWVLT